MASELHSACLAMNITESHVIKGGTIGIMELPERFIRHCCYLLVVRAKGMAKVSGRMKGAPEER